MTDDRTHADHRAAAERVATELVERYATEARDALTRRYRGALDDNPEGQSVLLDALREAALLGLRARWRSSARGFARQPPGLPELKRACDQLREEYFLAEEPSPVPKETEDQAQQLTLEAGQALGLAGNPGRGRAWRKRGREAALEGALVAEALARAAAGRGGIAPVAPAPAAPASGAPVSAAPVSGGHERLVSVGVAANLAEAELMRGRLEQAGVPSVERRTGSNTILMLDGGAREVYVPAHAAGVARRLLAPAPDEPRTEVDQGRTRPIGLERTWLRRSGKAVIWANVVPLAVAPLLIPVVVAVEAGVVAGVVFLALELIAIAAFVVLRKRRAHS